MSPEIVSQPHYRRTRDGQWVVAGPSSAIRAGVAVTVHKRDGSTKHELIESVGREYDDHGTKCRYGYVAARGHGGSGNRVPRYERCVRCGGDGSVERNLETCEACGADYDA